VEAAWECGANSCLIGFIGFIGLLVYWFIGLLVYWFIGLLVYWFIGLKICC